MNIPKMHRKNDILQNAFFLLYKMGTFHHARYNRRGYAYFSFAGYPKQARIAADCLLCVMMNACSVSVACIRR